MATRVVIVLDDETHALWSIACRSVERSQQSVLEKFIREFIAEYQERIGAKPKEPELYEPTIRRPEE